MKKQVITARTGIHEMDLFRRLIKSSIDTDKAYDIIMQTKDQRNYTIPKSQTVIIYQVSSDKFTVIGDAKQFPELLKPINKKECMSQTEITLSDYKFCDGSRFTLEELFLLNECKHAVDINNDNVWVLLVNKMASELLTLRRMKDGKVL
jgi:hypothetical protein